MFGYLSSRRGSANARLSTEGGAPDRRSLDISLLPRSSIRSKGGNCDLTGSGPRRLWGRLSRPRVEPLLLVRACPAFREDEDIVLNEGDV